MLFRLKCWLDQRQTIRRQKETIAVLKDALMRQPEVVQHHDLFFVRADGGWFMYKRVGFTPETSRRGDA